MKLNKINKLQARVDEELYFKVLYFVESEMITEAALLRRAVSKEIQRLEKLESKQNKK